MPAIIYSTGNTFYLQPGASFEINSGTGLVTVTADFKGPTPAGGIADYPIDSAIPIAGIHIPAGVVVPKIAKRKVTNNGDGFSTISTLSYGYFIENNPNTIFSKRKVYLSGSKSDSETVPQSGESPPLVTNYSWTVNETHDVYTYSIIGFVNRSEALDDPNSSLYNIKTSSSIKGTKKPGGASLLTVSWTRAFNEVSRVNYGAFDFVTYVLTLDADTVEL